MELDQIRKEIDKIDDAIKYLLLVRMACIPIVTKIKKENNMEFHQPGREKKMYEKLKKFAHETGISDNLLKDIYKIIIQESIRMEEEGATFENIEIDNQVLEKYKKLDDIIGTELPNAIQDIVKHTNDRNLYELITKIIERKV